MSRVFVLTLGFLVVVCVLVQRVIGQMHVNILEIFLRRSLIGLRAKASKRHLVQVDPQWVYSVDKNVES